MASKSERNLSAWEWRVLATAVRLESWEAAAVKLELANPYVVERIVRRLEADLGARLVREDDSGRIILTDPRFEALLGRVEGALDELNHVRRLASTESDGKAYRIRIDMYPGQVESFGASVIGTFEASKLAAGSRVELAPSFGSARAEGGIDLVRQLEDRRTDLVIAPVDAVRAGSADVWSSEWDGQTDAIEGGQPNGPSRASTRPLWVRPCYRWALVAAVGERGRRALRVERSGQRFLDVAELYSSEDGRPPNVVTSPPGHRTRELLDAQRPANRRFEVVTTSTEPAALIELGRHTDRVPIVASDSFAPSPTTTEFAEARGLWLTLTGNENGIPRVLGGAYGVFWREAHQPKAMVPLLRDLARRLAIAGADAASKALDFHLGTRPRPAFSSEVATHWDRLRGG